MFVNLRKKEKEITALANEKLSQKVISEMLRDDQHLCPNTKQKIDYFRDHLQAIYRSQKDELRPLNIDLKTFAELVINRHNERMKSANLSLKKTYFNHDSYIISLAKDTLESTLLYHDPANPFARPGNFNPRVSRFQNIIHARTQALQNVNRTSLSRDKQVLLDITKRYYDQKVAGLLLLERELYNDALIVWRSLLETTTTLLLLAENPELTGRYEVRRELALMHAQLIKSDEQTLREKSRETQKHASNKSIPYFTAERFGWAGSLIKEQEFSLKTLLALVNLHDYYAHYAFASLFVHEYLISAKHFRNLITFEQYLLTLYFKLYEVTRTVIVSEFTKDKKEEKKAEKLLRDEISNMRGRFTDFSLLISNV